MCSGYALVSVTGFTLSGRREQHGRRHSISIMWNDTLDCAAPCIRGLPHSGGAIFKIPF